MAQIGETLCSCSPTSFTVTLDFSLTCFDANIVAFGDGVVTTDCSITPFQGEVRFLVPVSVFSADFLELDQDGQVLNQRSSFVDLEGGDTLSYELFSINPELVNELTAPKTLIVSFIARNAAREPLFMQYLITYSNSCDAFPVLFPGQQIGWTRFTILEDPSLDICTSADTLFPTSSPTRASVPTRAPAAPAPTATKGGKGKGKGKYNIFVRGRDKGKNKARKVRITRKSRERQKEQKERKKEEDGNIVYCDEVVP